MRGESSCAVCCCSLCQHPECWRASLQQVREAVWRRNGVKPPESNRSSVDMGSLYLREKQSDSSEGTDRTPGGLYESSVFGRNKILLSVVYSGILL